jgi:hypothetical protein
MLPNSGSYIFVFVTTDMERYDLRIVSLILKHFRRIRKIVKNDY